MPETHPNNAKALLRWANTSERKTKLSKLATRLPWLKTAMERVSQRSHEERLFGGQQRFDTQYLAYQNGAWKDFYRQKERDIAKALKGRWGDYADREETRMRMEVDSLALAIERHRTLDAASKQEMREFQKLVASSAQTKAEIRAARSPKLNGESLRSVQVGSDGMTTSQGPTGEQHKPSAEHQTTSPAAGSARYVSRGTNRVSEDIGRDYDQNVALVREQFANDPTVTIQEGPQSREFTVKRGDEVVHSVCDDRSPEEMARDNREAEQENSLEAARATAARQTAASERADTSRADGFAVRNETAELLCETHQTPARDAREMAFHRDPANWFKSEHELKHDFILSERHAQFGRNPDYLRIANEVSRLKSQGKVQDVKQAMDAIVMNTHEGDLADFRATSENVMNVIATENAQRAPLPPGQPRNRWEAEKAQAREDYAREFAQTPGEEKPAKAIARLNKEAEMLRDNPNLTPEYCESFVRGEERLLSIQGYADQGRIFDQLRDSGAHDPIEVLGAVSEKSFARMRTDADFTREIVGYQHEAHPPAKPSAQEQTQAQEHTHKQATEPDRTHDEGPTR